MRKGLSIAGSLALPFLLLVVLTACASASVPAETSTPTPAPTETSTPTPTPAATLTHVALLSFGAPVGDDELIELLEQHGATAFTGYTLAGEFTGTVPAWEWHVSPAGFVAEVRGHVIKNAVSRLESHLPRRIREFLSRHTLQDLLTYPRPRELAIQLLNSYSNAEAALAALQDGEPFIHAVAVVGREAQLQQLGKDERVWQFAMVEIGEDKHIINPFIPSLSEEAERQRVELQRWVTPPPEDSEMLYRRLQAIVPEEEK